VFRANVRGLSAA